MGQLLFCSRYNQVRWSKERQTVSGCYLLAEGVSGDFDGVHVELPVGGAVHGHVGEVPAEVRGVRAAQDHLPALRRARVPAHTHMLTRADTSHHSILVHTSSTLLYLFK